ncbi:hypothetical protein ACFVY4_26810 [Streptomyces sp. NPDC058299]|uniref:hypothetical protein n=1 Tax=Streptomyces sp. NPDC058299 TaxID=3346435 RepID=UPI0036F066DE
MPTDPRRVYLDTEFLITQPCTTGLVALALTDEDGNDYCAVNAEMDTFHVYSHPWMQEHVWPHLPTLPGMPHRLDYTHPDVKPLAQIADEVAAYFSTGRDTHLYAYYGAHDLFRLHSLWGHNWQVMPRQIPRWHFDLRALQEQAGNPDLPEQDSGAHHPLEDARHNRRMHEHLLSLGTLPGPTVQQEEITHLHARVRELEGAEAAVAATARARAFRDAAAALDSDDTCDCHGCVSCTSRWHAQQFRALADEAERTGPAARAGDTR